MALTNYSDLQTSVANYLARSDLTSQIPDFISLCEAKLRRRFRDVTSLSVSNTTNWLLTNHPDVYLYGTLLEAQPYLMDDARIATWAQIFDRVVAEVRRPNSSANLTNYSGLQLSVSDWLNRPDLDEAIPEFIRLAEVRFAIKFKNFTSLSTGSPTNSTLTSYPNLYLYGALVEAANYLNDKESLAVWKQEYETQLSLVRVTDTTTAFDTYSGLQSAIIDWIQRPDLASNAPDFIRLAEARFAIKFKSFTPLSVGSPTNTVLTNYPDLYFYGALVEAANYLNDKDSLAVWKQEYENRLSLVRVTDTTTAFDTYAGLQSAVIDWLDRPDLAGNVADFIKVAEVKLQRRFKGVTSLGGAVTTNWLLTANPDVYLYASLFEAAGYLNDEARAAAWATAYESAASKVRLPDTTSNFTNYAGLQASIADWLDRPDLTNAIPNFIRLAEAKLQRRFVDVTTLTTINTTNWLLTSHPDVYLYASLVEAAPYIKDDPRIPVWLENYNVRVAEVRRPSTSANFTNYTGFKAMVADWLDRPDLTNIIPTLITMGEYRLQRELRIRQMLVVATAQTTANDITVGLPTNYLEMRDIHLETTPIQNLKYYAPNTFYSNTRIKEAGKPVAYTLLGAEMQLSPIPDAAYTLKMLYYAKPTVLSDSNASNVFLASCPDALLYASLLEAEPYLKNDARVQTWNMMYDRAVAALTLADSAGQYGGQPLSIISK